MRVHRIATISRLTLLEAWRTRLPWLFGALLAAVLAGAVFVGELTITESTRIQAGFCGSLLRAGAVLVMCLHVIGSMVREMNDKGLELALSFDVRRGDYLCGRLAGFLLAAVPVAVMAALPQCLFAPPAAVLPWALSLLFELWIMVALSLFCVITFAQLIPAAVFVCAFYLLARTLTAIRLISDAPIAGASSPSHRLMAHGVDGMALFMPALDGYAPSAWLADAAPAWGLIGAQGVHALVYAALLTAAALFDFYRRNI